MPNIGQILKGEISRLSRKEVRQQSNPLKRSTTTHRHEIAMLKRKVASLERQLRLLQRSAARPNRAAASEDESAKLRFRAAGFRALRTRLGISAAQMGKLLGVSGQSVYAWETQRASPRKAQLPGIATVRRLGKREVLRRLDASNGNS